MNKKFSKSFLLFLCLTLAFFVVGCKNNDNNNNNNNNNVNNNNNNSGGSNYGGNTNPQTADKTAAVPTTANMPEPIIAPTPSIIKSQTPRVFSNPPSLAPAKASSGFFLVNILASTFFSIICYPFVLLIDNLKVGN